MLQTRMQIFIEAIDLNIWEAIEVEHYVPTMAAGNTTIEKPREEWSEEERRLVQHNLKAKNIITFVLGMDEYFRVSNCKSAKDIIMLSVFFSYINKYLFELILKRGMGKSWKKNT